tara:strand:+ start:481 stop:675 length:195 start_codon:yes stop_codon:yes gene_type:complete
MNRNVNNRTRNIIATTLIACGAFFVGCGSQAMDGLAIGGAAGGGIGYIIGNELDKINIWDAINN